MVLKMNNIEEKYLPIGSVVKLLNVNKKIMITGFLSSDINDNSKSYDYTGCIYPEGILDSKKLILFNHDQIENIIYIGYKSDEESKFKEFLKTQNKDN